MKKIKVFLRQWNGATSRKQHVRPDWFSYEKCYRSIKDSKDIDITILLDGTQEKHHFGFDNSDSVIEFTGGSDFKSFEFCLKTMEAANLKDDDIVYIVEDDYLHKEGWSDILLEAYDSFDVDYVTLYDHKDKYFLPMYEELQSKILCTENSHWRTTPSTCNTYSGRWATFKKHMHIHKKYCITENAVGAYDHSKFVELWQSGSNLISSIPGFTTHCEQQFLSPITNWSKI